MAERAYRHPYIEDLAGPGERIIVVAGVPFGTVGGTNNLRRDNRLVGESAPAEPQSAPSNGSR